MCNQKSCIGRECECNKPTPHKHAELIKQWADGCTIQWYNARMNRWESEPTPCWNEETTYRIKPEPKLDWYRYAHVQLVNGYISAKATLKPENNFTNVKFTFDGETNELINVEMIK